MMVPPLSAPALTMFNHQPPCTRVFFLDRGYHWDMYAQASNAGHLPGGDPPRTVAHLRLAREPESTSLSPQATVAKRFVLHHGAVMEDGWTPCTAAHRRCWIEKMFRAVGRRRHNTRYEIVFSDVW